MSAGAVEDPGIEPIMARAIAKRNVRFEVMRAATRKSAMGAKETLGEPPVLIP